MKKLHKRIRIRLIRLSTNRTVYTFEFEESLDPDLLMKTLRAFWKKETLPLTATKFFDFKRSFDTFLSSHKIVEDFIWKYN